MLTEIFTEMTDRKASQISLFYPEQPAVRQDFGFRELSVEHYRRCFYFFYETIANLTLLYHATESQTQPVAIQLYRHTYYMQALVFKSVAVYANRVKIDRRFRMVLNQFMSDSTPRIVNKTQMTK